MFRLGAFAVIFDEAKNVLLQHRKDVKGWALPEGIIESKEAPCATCIREVKEEIGVDVEVSRLVGVYSKPSIDVLVFVFECQIKSGSFTNSDESDAVSYFPFNGLPKGMPKFDLQRISDAYSLNQTVFREQTDE